jgi:argininosuccinate lyase
VHLNIEARLTQLVGAAGKRLHTGRSRNDQVATDVRLWLRGEIDQLAPLLAAMQQALVDLASEHTQTVMPGYTHMQVAQPVSFAHHLLAYVEMFWRDSQRLADVRKRVNQLPLGAAALAGTSYPLDRERVARTLGFDGICGNSLDAVSDRDFALEFAAFASICMVHVSRLSEEIVLWMSQNFGFIDLADRYCTGSSIMPQKRNPDVAELARGKSGRVIGHLMGLITLMKGQPLTYNKDNQEDKEPLFDTVDTLRDTLRIMAEMVGGITVKADAMERAALRGYATATDLADYLVKKGPALPRRARNRGARGEDRHRPRRGSGRTAIGRVAGAQRHHHADVAEVLTLRGSLNARNVWPAARRRRRCSCRSKGTAHVWQAEGHISPVACMQLGIPQPLTAAQAAVRRGLSPVASMRPGLRQPLTAAQAAVRRGLSPVASMRPGLRQPLTAAQAAVRRGLSRQTRCVWPRCAGRRPTARP